MTRKFKFISNSFISLKDRIWVGEKNIDHVKNIHQLACKATTRTAGVLWASITCLFLCGTSSGYAQVTIEDFEVYGPGVVFDRLPNVLFIVGEIRENDFLEIRRFIRQNDVDYFVLSSPGGSVVEALQIGAMINDLEIATVIPLNGNCASSCSFLFFAGQPRLALGQLGVHQFSSNGEFESEFVTQYATSEIISFLNEFGTPAFVYEHMFRDQEMHFFDQQHLLEVSTVDRSYFSLNLAEVERVLHEFYNLLAGESNAQGEQQEPPILPITTPETPLANLNEIGASDRIESEQLTLQPFLESQIQFQISVTFEFSIEVLSAGEQFWADGEVGIHMYDDGGIYEGTFENGVPHGRGIYLREDGFGYTGDWVNGEVSGQGRIFFPTTISVYEGAFTEGRAQGFGVITFNDGGTYEGEWSEGRINGQGIARYANDATYEGSFRDGLPHGRGEANGNGTRFPNIFGSWQNGVPHGFILITYPDGTRYEGSIEQGHISGAGEVVFANGIVYNGEWRNGHFYGWGRLSHSGGYLYDGPWRNGIRHGIGTERYTDGSEYVGSFSLNQREGIGNLSRPDGFFYRGEWLNDEIHGEGRAIYANGDIYHGNFVNGHRHGAGDFRGVDGVLYSGQWQDDTINGEGRATYANGDVYEGRFVNGVPEGFGVMTYAAIENQEARILQGVWENGTLIYETRAN